MNPIELYREFGALWLVLVPVVGLIVGGIALLLALGHSRSPLLRLGEGGERLTGLPEWIAVPVLTVLVIALPAAALGFYWDVAWHIDIGRDKFLFSPPHVALLIGLSSLGIAGVLGIVLATLRQAPTTWRVRYLRLPFGAAVLLVAGFISMVGYFVDELWHWAYGLDVSMWGPTHLTMVSAAAFSPFAVWMLLGEAGAGVGRPAIVRTLRLSTAMVTVIALSAWQLEFDLGVPQFQALYHPVLIALTAGLGLTVCRVAAGRGGAIAGAALALAVRGMFGAIVHGLDLTPPRVPLYLAAAVAVEVVFAWQERRTSLATPRTALVAGLAVATVGLAAEALWTQVHAFFPWSTTMVPGLWVAVVVALVGAVLGTAAGNVSAHRPSGVRAPIVALCFAGLALGVIVPLPRHVPEADVTVRTTPAGEDRVDVSVEVSPADAVGDVDRFEVMAWQGQGSAHADLVRVAPGRYEADGSVPVGADWKTVVLLASRDHLGAVAIWLPQDDAIGADELPVVPVRTGPFRSLSGTLQREAHAGPAWPGVIAYAWVLLSIGTLVGTLVAGFVALERRRRGAAIPVTSVPTLAGRRVVVTGAAGGIGAALVAALESQGAKVAGIDRVAPDASTIIAADVTDLAQVEWAVGEAERRLGGIDVLVNNAGIGSVGDAGAPPDDTVRRTVDVNLFGAWNVTAAALPALLAARGHVVNVASGLAVANVPYAAGYSASKRALLAHTDTLRAEYGDRLRISSVLPGYIATAIHDGPAEVGVSLAGITREGSVADAVAAVVTAIETGRRDVASTPMLHAQLLGARLAPSIADRVIARRVRRKFRGQPRPVFVRAAATASSRARPRRRVPSA
jgi:NAD(P)-dependent dehydrogenase (short-subunit alcohol dehydrogenase family)